MNKFPLNLTIQAIYMYLREFYRLYNKNESNRSEKTRIYLMKNLNRLLFHELFIKLSFNWYEYLKKETFLCFTSIDKNKLTANLLQENRKGLQWRRCAFYNLSILQGGKFHIPQICDLSIK